MCMHGASLARVISASKEGSDWLVALRVPEVPLDVAFSSSNTNTTTLHLRSCSSINITVDPANQLSWRPVTTTLLALLRAHRHQQPCRKATTSASGPCVRIEIAQAAHQAR
jgi:hypothetical protein